MKKNLALAGLLAALLIVTYFVQEKRVEREYVEARKKGKLVEGEITSMKFGAVTAVKKNQQWWQGTQLLSHNALKLLEERLRQLTSIKDITDPNAPVFNDAVAFEINGEPWRLGDLSLDKQSFYVSKGTKVYLAFVDGEGGVVAQDEAELEAKKLTELKGLLTKDLRTLKRHSSSGTTRTFR
jgi:hypothetical protein